MKAVQDGNQIWLAFNYMPGGQIVAQHFEDLEGQKKIGDSEHEVKVSAKEQVESFKKQDNVTLFVKGVLKKNEVLIYSGPSLLRNPRAAEVVINWAKEQGMQPIRATADQKGTDPKTYEYDKRIGALEGDVKEIKDGMVKILEAVGGKK